MIKVSIILLLYIVFVPFSFAQKKENDPTKGLLELKLEKTYWDKEQKKLRSEGYMNVAGFDAIGQRYGKWKFYYKNGNLEEVSEYYAGKLNGQITQYYIYLLSRKLLIPNSLIRFLNLFRLLHI
jgi:hypothetical protein